MAQNLISRVKSVITPELVRTSNAKTQAAGVGERCLYSFPKEVERMQQTELKVGDNAVYAGNGIGRIISIETKELCGIKQTFYRFQLYNSTVSALVPVNNPDSKLRPIISRDEVIKVVSIVKQKDIKIDKQTWNRRYREYMEKIKTG